MCVFCKIVNGEIPGFKLYENDLDKVHRDCYLRGDVSYTTTTSGKRCARCVRCSEKGQIYCEGSCVSKEYCCTWGLPDYEYGLLGCHNGQKCNTSTGTCYTPSSSNQSPTTQSDGCPDTEPERIAWCEARGYENKQMNCEEAEMCKCNGNYLKCIKW